jgi:hypothetical protein
MINAVLSAMNDLPSCGIKLVITKDLWGFSGKREKNCAVLETPERLLPAVDFRPMADTDLGISDIISDSF